jgi:hypothetical protein
MYQLHKPRFRPLPLGSIHPRGWLKNQLQIQADGISGHLDEFWPDIRDSQWFGGDAEAWERAPYWLDGLIPLAYTLDDPILKDKVKTYMSRIIEQQHDDGWLGPRTMVAASGQSARPRYDLWGQILATKVLMQYTEATGDERGTVALARLLRGIEHTLDRTPLFDWGQFRWFETLLAIYWLYEKQGGSWLLDLATKLHAQGFDWAGFFSSATGWPAAHPTPKGRWNYMSHVVNNAMAPKAHALWWRLSGEERDQAAVYEMLEKLHRHHGMVTGVVTGDECLVGKNPIHGTELCSVVELAYSLEVLLSILGDPIFADQLEKVIFNALPATFSPDMWSHQYDQQVNQVECSIREDRIWGTNGPESNIFGVEPNYGCCTANLSQGWPKFAAHLWMRTVGDSKNEGLVAAAYAPSIVETTIQGVPISAEIDTKYPFRDEVHIRVDAKSPVRFPLLLRVPGWSENPIIQQVDGSDTLLNPGSFHRLKRRWQGTTELTLRFPMPTQYWRGFRNATAVQRGPLVYALKVGERWERVHEDEPYRELPHGDWELYPTTPWNYALVSDEATSELDITFKTQPVGDCPFSPDGAPMTAQVRARRLPNWKLKHGSAGETPMSPVSTEEPLETVTLIPYGCTNLRITEFPTTGLVSPDEKGVSDES